MAYSDHFKAADDMISHLDHVVAGVNDSFITSRYVGFVAVAAVTVYELAIKEIFFEFAQRKHRVFGNFVSNRFDRLNGRIRLNDITERFLPGFGEKYCRRFTKKLNAVNERNIRANKGCVKSAYGNIITWRNQFAHDGRIPSTPTYTEVTVAYSTGKIVIDCLADTMWR